MEVVKQFVDYGVNNRCPVSELRELATGLEEYLDKLLQKRLLYTAEWDDAEKVNHRLFIRVFCKSQLELHTNALPHFCVHV